MLVIWRCSSKEREVHKPFKGVKVPVGSLQPTRQSVSRLRHFPGTTLQAKLPSSRFYFLPFLSRHPIQFNVSCLLDTVKLVISDECVERNCHKTRSHLKTIITRALCGFHDAVMTYDSGQSEK